MGKQLAELRGRLALRAYKTERGGELTKHDLRRCPETLARIIDQLYDVLPAYKEYSPSREKVIGATTVIQAMNAFGCLENIASSVCCMKRTLTMAAAHFLNGERLSWARNRFGKIVRAISRVPR